MCRSIALVVLAVVALPMAAQKPVSGPPRGTTLPALRVAAVAGADAGREFDLAERLRLGPAAVLFVHALDRNTAPVLRAFDQESAALAVLGMTAGIVYLAPDRTEAEQRVPVVSRALSLLTPMLVSADGAEGPGGYALSRKATLTLVLARDGVVTDSVTLVDTGRQDLEFLQLCLASIAGTPPDDRELSTAVERAVPAEVPALRRIVVQLEQQRRVLLQQLEQARQAQAAARRGDAVRPAMTDAAPAARPAATREPPPTEADAVAAVAAAVQDAELGQIVRRWLRRDATASDLDDAMAALERRLQAEPTVREQAIAAGKAILAHQAGSEAARQRLRDWLQRQGG
ncbi:MAG: hypothetical protein IPK26_09255 [Planctomycetes bacterium]|nr:hypothetical protein [Planctomycetota bacterium]